MPDVTFRPSELMPRIDARSADSQQAADALRELRHKLSPRGDAVSPRGRALTEEVFGQPLTPSEVVQRICGDVRSEGTAGF